MSTSVIRTPNAGWITTRNAANNADLNLIRADSSNRTELTLGSATFVLTSASTQTTVGAAGGASALPATPTGYLRVLIGGAEKVIPYYDQA